MKRWAQVRGTLLLIGLAVSAAFAQPPTPGGAQMPPPVNLQPLRAKANVLFKPAVFTEEPSQLKEAGDLVLLGSQLVGAAIVIGGLLVKMREEHRQMEGVAAMLLKVAFIATIPAWQLNFVSATDSLAAAIGYKPATEQDSPAMTDLWALLQQWAPPSSPALDALDAQAPDKPPGSGSEASWSVNAWNWAKGIGVADASMFHALWQAASGSLRALLVFGSCAAMACAVSFVVALTYFAELLRYLLLTGGVALLPIFIAGVGIDALRSHSIRAILGIATVAAWPIGWALANIVTDVMTSGTQAWMADAAQAALSSMALPAGPFSVAAPYLPWATLFLFVGITAALCGWQMAALYYVPVLLARLFAASTATASAIFGTHFDSVDVSPRSRLQPSAAPAATTPNLAVNSARGRESQPVLAARIPRPPPRVLTPRGARD